MRFTRMRRRVPLLLFGVASLFASTHSLSADDFDEVLRPLLSQRCAKCHGPDEVNAEVDFRTVATRAAILKQPELLQRMLDAIETSSMPPETEPALSEPVRVQATRVLKKLLREATAGTAARDAQLQRLNRFQYNNTVRDLFQLDRDVFALPEKLMTRYDNYLGSQSSASPLTEMPETVEVASNSLNPIPGLRDVRPFPKDLRAQHGFDNQANQLTLSPLLLDAFLRLSVSIVESPDFNPQTVGIWDEFFAQPEAGTDLPSEVRTRVEPFLELAFRGPVERDTVDRYTAYALSRMQQGLTFTDSMKKLASAVMSSPLFLYRAVSTNAVERQFELASDLSYFLWGSCPDRELLELARAGELSKPQVLNRTIDRMLADPRIERFLDSFPAQWMQLENLLAVTPDPQINRYFSLDPNAPASLQMVLEPLLLFDTVFVENRPIQELIAPEFSYRSAFLETWYRDDLQPPPVDEAAIAAQNRSNDERRRVAAARLQSARSELAALTDPVRKQLLEARNDRDQSQPLVDLKPYAAWEFDGDLKESVRGLDLTAHGDIELQDGKVVLNRAFLLSKPLPVDLKAKSLEVWCSLPNLDQRGGGLMGIQGPGDFFDTIVIGERKNRHWISGSNGFSRTDDFPDSMEESLVNELLHLVMVYAEDGTTTLYRNGQPYGRPFRKGSATFPREKSSVIFGLRHLPPGGNKFLSTSIDQARLYDRALTADEVQAAASGHSSYVSDQDVLAALTDEQKKQHDELLMTIKAAEVELKSVPANRDINQVVRETQRRFDDELKRQLRLRGFRRRPAADPRYGGVITNAAMLSMTSGPKRTHPVARGVWIIEVIFNDPPAPPPNDVPPLNEDAGGEELTIREKFAAHRENPSCAGCHTKLDPLGFALENFDITGRWRSKYDNGRDVDVSGRLMRKHEFNDVVKFKEALILEKRRFAKAFTEHLLRFALARELQPTDAVTVDSIVNQTEPDGFRLKSLIREVVLSSTFRE